MRRIHKTAPALAVLIGLCCGDAAAAQSRAVAVLRPRALDGFPGIAIPVVTGIPAPAARRINLVLDRDRAKAVAAAESCRSTAAGRPSQFEQKATAAYDRNGLLSLRFAGSAMCGGAHGGVIADARTFDLATGRTIDVAAATGLTLPALGRLAARRYTGGADCRAFLVRRIGSADVAARAAYLVPKGVAVLYDFNVGAAESCGADPAIVPASRLRAAARSRSILNRL